MITIQQAVDRIVREKPFMEEALHEGLINLSALALSIKPQVEDVIAKPVKKGSIVMALKRHEPGRLIPITVKAQRLASNIHNIIVRSNISVFTFENSINLYRKITEFSKRLQMEKGLFFTFSYGVFETTLIVNSKAENDIQQMFADEKQLTHEDKLACVTLYLPDENTEVAGYYYYILKLIAWEGINIVEVLSTTNEFSLIIRDKDVDRAFSALKQQ
ncbi:MAG: aspartate kinase [Bacteroidales bacterium]|nr:aspartate kinase [Bacteroidales bacterium]